MTVNRSGKDKADEKVGNTEVCMREQRRNKEAVRWEGQTEEKEGRSSVCREDQKKHKEVGGNEREGRRKLRKEYGMKRRTEENK